MKPPLFRAEALQARSHPWMGTVSRIPPCVGSGWMVGAALWGAALVAVLVWGEYARTVRLQGVLLPEGGLLAVQAPAAAQAVHFAVQEGQWVEAGARLARLDHEVSGSEGPLVDVQLRHLRARRAASQRERAAADVAAERAVEALNHRRRALQREMQIHMAELETLEARRALAASHEQRQLQLVQSGFLSPAHAQQPAESVLEWQQRIQAARRAAVVLARDLRAIDDEVRARQAQHQMAQAQWDRQLATMAQEEQELLSRTASWLTAPQAGRVSALGVPFGQSVGAGQVVLTLLPQARPHQTSPLQAVFHVPGKAAAWLAVGQPVWLRHDAFAHQKFGLAAGRVTALTPTPALSADPWSRTPAARPQFRVTVALEHEKVWAHGAEHALRPGMQVEADVVHDRRRLWEWMVEPLLTARQGRGTAAPHGIQGAVS